MKFQLWVKVVRNNVAIVRNVVTQWDINNQSWKIVAITRNKVWGQNCEIWNEIKWNHNCQIWSQNCDK